MGWVGEARPWGEDRGGGRAENVPGYTVGSD